MCFEIWNSFVLTRVSETIIEYKSAYAAEKYFVSLYHKPYTYLTTPTTVVGNITRHYCVLLDMTVYSIYLTE